MNKLTPILRVLVVIAALVFAGVPARAQSRVQLFTQNLQYDEAGQRSVTIPHALHLTLDQAVSQQMRSQQFVELANVPLPGGATVSLSLSAFSVFTPDVRLIAETKSGPVALAQPNVVLFNGAVDGDDRSSAYIALYNNKASGFIKTEGHEYWIGAEDGGGAGYSMSNCCRIYDAADIPEGLMQATCQNPSSDAGTIEAVRHETTESSGMPFTPVQINSGTQPTYRVQVAIDVDSEGFAKLNSDPVACMNYITQMFGAVSTIYHNEANVDVQISYFHVWETLPEPYTQGTGAGEAGLTPALNEVATWWQKNMDTVSRSAMMLITGKPVCGVGQDLACGVGEVEFGDIDGIHLGVLCQNKYAYSITAISADTLLPQLDEEIAAHELGHNFGLLHSQNCFWLDSNYTMAPLDQCAASEADPYTHSAGCVTGTVPSKGTIMSYCTQKSFTFGNVIGPWLKNHVLHDAGSLWSCVQQDGTPVFEHQQTESQLILNQNYPNPVDVNSGETTTFVYSLHSSSNVTINVYTMFGQCVDVLQEGLIGAGTHSIVYDARKLTTGTYFVKLHSGAESQTVTMTVMR